MRKVRVLVAVQPPSLLRVIEHLLGDAAELQIIPYSSAASNLPRRVRVLQPELIIANAAQLGNGAVAALARLKRASPRSRLLLMDFNGSLAGLAVQRGVDLYLQEEALVKRLLPATRTLLRPILRAPRPTSSPRQRTRPRSPAPSKSR